MRGWIIGMAALLSAAAHAQSAYEPYATVGQWEISAKTPKKICMMSRWYGNVDADETDGLMVLYNAQKETALLGWGSNKMKFLPAKGALDFDLSFLKGSSLDESWGSQSFEYEKLDKKYVFTHVFTGAADVRRILRDLGANESITLFFGPNVITGLPLAASDAVEKLRECASKLAGTDTPAPLPK
jgi:hypothetical protein